MAQSVEFLIAPKLGTGLRLFFHSQLFVTPAFPTQSFANQTVIVTGSNTGLGLEAARHFYRLNCARLILAVRTVSKGEAAKENILGSVRQRTDPDAIEIWPLNLSSTASTLAFADRAKTELSRVDVLVENAGINTADWVIVEGYEQAVQVNVLNTLLLALSLLPKLTETKTSFPDSTPHLVIVSSEAHRLTKFPEINAPDLYAQLNNKADFSQQPRYQATKLIEVLFTRELITRLKTPATPPVIINLVNPGLCTSDLDRRGAPQPLLMRILHRLFDRTTEVGGRTFVLAASAPLSSHGEFQSDGENQDVESWVYTDVGKRAQKKVFDQTLKILELRKPGIAREVGL
ncbi:NAD(P)-binding protein [Aspergillus sclerotiicarbonarius CBS 121057]|uniref:NAD(P)-binding protein n=1 Tax=Aspergillus sclerotiicarbonarius (strain CBS 121057 / IBT 28362) TaxID=1448318 RepID=A0A319FLM6_ASPSB|nr:NAD(P)-binding protein [Aspergillus sclerotiicarbonarius CBS 121057]